MLDALKNHWPEYMIEAWCLGTFMTSACFFAVILFHPGSPTAQIPFAFKNLLMGVAMGSTALAIISSPWGKRSGAHFNPAVTLTFLRLGKMGRFDALFYIIAQFAGGIVGVLFAGLVLGGLLSDRSVNYVATVPGPYGTTLAFLAEVIISFFMMAMVLFTSNTTNLARWTPYFAGLLVATYIALESPISGMSMNPARSFASGIVGNIWTGWWIYFTAPLAGMIGASEVFVRRRGISAVLCGKLNHSGSGRCIFNCSHCIQQVVEVSKSPHIFPTALLLF